MLSRCQLAALDHNSGVGLDQAKTKDGQLRYRVLHTKMGKKWVVKPIKASKDVKYKHDMVDRVVEIVRDNIDIPAPDIPSLPRNIASTPKPDKSEAILAFRSRFKSTLDSRAVLCPIEQGQRESDSDAASMQP